MSIEVEISDTQGYLKVERATLVGLVERTLTGLGCARASISIALLDDATIRAVNRAHLGRDRPTDVISFRLSEPDDRVLSGELVISVQTACATALQIGAEPGEELALYVVHGLLHLCGYDDASEAERSMMRRREGEILTREGLPNPHARAAERRPRQAPGSREMRLEGGWRLARARGLRRDH
jgi:probable rRNA maturation factor